MDSIKFEFVDNTITKDEKISSEVPDVLGSGANEKSSHSADTKSKKSFGDTFTTKAGNDLVRDTIISPLNTATGGLASPLYRSAKQLISGSATFGAVAGSLTASLAIIAVQKGIEALLRGRTSFVIAHRLSTIQNADRIFVIGDGGIMEQGTAKELIEKKGFYYELYMAQFTNL